MRFAAYAQGPKSMRGDRKRLPQALFFDFDGVILDTTRIKSEGFRKLFKEYSEQVINKIIAYHQLHGGISRVDKILYAHETIIGTPLSAIELEAWARQYSELVLEEVIAAPWIAGAKHFLELWPQEIPVFVISGTPEQELLAILERRKMKKFFDEVLGSPTKKVPHIEMLLRKYHVDPESCLFVGDAMTDYNAAKDTCLRFIGIQSDTSFPAGTFVLPDCTMLKEAILQLFNEPSGGC